MVTWNLTQIISKVRNVTGTPSALQLSDADITNYVNSYYQFTMPFELKEQRNFQPYNFNTFANVDTYDVSTAFQTDEPMAYANGFPLVFYQDRDVFFQDWPQQYTQDQAATGNNTVGPYTGTTLASPVIPNTFYITDGTQIVSDVGSNVSGEVIALGAASVGPYAATLDNFPIQPGTLQITAGGQTAQDNGVGGLVSGSTPAGTITYATGVISVTFPSAVGLGVSITADYSLPSGSGILSGNGSGTLNYLTGAFSVTFNAAVTTGTVIYDNYQAYQPARPQGVLFYNNQLTFRPIPDQVYQITLQGFITQVALDDVTNLNQVPLQTEWGQLIAYGAALDIFSDRGDLEAYQQYYPIFKRFENVALGRFVEQFQNAQSVPRF